jgi:hypothetical protein
VAERADRRWRLVWSVAAAVVLALNLGMSAANGIRFQRLYTAAAAQGGFERQAARPRVPDGFDANERFHAFAASALAHLTPAPDAGALGRHLFSKEERGWALP